MLRFLTLIARADAFDHTGGNTHTLFGQALLTNLVYQTLDHVKSAWRRNQAQRDQTFIHDTDRLSKADLGGRDLSLLCRLEHERADHQMGQQKRVDLLNDSFRSQTAQGSRRQTQVRTRLIDDHFDVPTFMIQHGYLFGRVEKGIEQGGHQSIHLFAGSWNTWISEGVSDDAHQHALPTVMVLIDIGQVGPIQQIVAGFEQDIALQASQHMPSTGSYLEDGTTRMKPTIPQDQALLQRPAFQEQTCASGFGLSARTDFHVTDQVGPTFDQEQETCLGKGTMREFIIATVAEGFSIVSRVSYRLDGAVDGKQTHPFPKSPWCLDSGFGASTMGKDLLQDLTSQLGAPVTQSRSGRDLLSYIVTDRSLTAHHFAIHPALGQRWIQMQSHQPVDDCHHIRFSFSLFPHLVSLQKLFYQAGRDHFLQQSHIDLLANLVLQPIFRYANNHEACPFLEIFDGLSMPSGLPLCLLTYTLN